MDQDAIRQLLKSRDPSTTEEVIRIMQEARVNPEVARTLWEALISLSGEDPSFTFILNTLLESVLIDHISDRMARDPDYALVISRRITDFMGKIILPQSKQVRTA